VAQLFGSKNIPMPSVNPEILRWARESAELTLAAAAEKLALGAARNFSGVERLAALEDGSKAPSRPLLLKMAKLYRRPLLTFYLSKPPRKGQRGEDFRNLPDQHSVSEPLVDALLRDIKARQSMVRSLLEDDEDHAPLDFIGSMGVASGVDQVLGSIQHTLRIDISDFRAQGSVERAFSYLRERVEAAGVFVLLIGNLGSHHTNLDVSTFRGFALADPIAPFVVINDQDAKSAWAFTLLHEVAHLWLGATGISGSLADNRLERFCNEVASQFLLPAQELSTLALRSGADLDALALHIGEFASTRLVSRSLVAYRLLRAARIPDDTWQALASRFQQEWRAHREQQRQRGRDQESGPNYYIVRRHRLGGALLRLVDRSISEGALTPTKAGTVLGVKARSVAPLLSGPRREVA
jgi:Zn-dependent peptidase ImmA (M78 family)/transcriptional regulator with XRE-family HTH domain